ncbi:uncharacterized protein LOC107647927 [Arachis ipaensis]|uniref:Pectinesterase inhibitor domain-containing protein n=1 Tax=Arachis hypogaea TaxID=3818 RepID=A0A444YHU0_ARAHY|nr:uncharacterized protein LOC107647927 [Arachis ipaensis]XP_025662274.1 uncharacterized protein LOC112757949 [Arachis hypogaea]QHN84538.1 uncharacterized protein DS421_16g529480 [Arachis hypogaea]RYR01439.1 hypothetical protein Ahy_B06g080306 [Arachis hypogaea]
MKILFVLLIITMKEEGPIVEKGVGDERPRSSDEVLAKCNHARGEATAVLGPSLKLKKAIMPREQITVVESCDTLFASTSRVSENVMRFLEGDGGCGSMSRGDEAGPSMTAFNLTIISSPGGLCSNKKPFRRATVEDWKPKGWATEYWEC